MQVAGDNNRVVLTGTTIGGAPGMVINGDSNSITIDAASRIGSYSGEGLEIAGDNNHAVNRGTIEGRVLYRDGSGNTFVNSGTVTGGTAFEGDAGPAIRLGPGSNGLVLQAGSVINGNVEGGGESLMTLQGSGSLTSDVSNFQTLTMEGPGAWDLGATAPSPAAPRLPAGRSWRTGCSRHQFRQRGRHARGCRDRRQRDGKREAARSLRVIRWERLRSMAMSRSTRARAFRWPLRRPVARARLNASGTASVGGASVQVLADPGSYPLNTRYTILSAGGGVVGTFADLSTSTNVTSPFLVPRLVYDPTNVFFTLGTDFVSAAITPNQRAVAGYLDRVAGDPGMQSLVGRLLGMSVPAGAAHVRLDGR